MADPGDLLPGFHQVGQGEKSSYRGVLRAAPGRVPKWSCPHAHLFPGGAKGCAEAELERRRQAQRQVFTLLHCDSCDRWWAPVPEGDCLCPACSKPGEHVKLVVLERIPPVDEGNRQH